MLWIHSSDSALGGPLEADQTIHKVATLQHPGIVLYLDFCKLKGQYRGVHEKSSRSLVGYF